MPLTSCPSLSGEEAIARLDKLRNAKGSLKTAQIRRTMQRTMQNHAAVFRTSALLSEGCALIDSVVDSFRDVQVRGRERGLLRLEYRRWWWWWWRRS